MTDLFVELVVVGTGTVIWIIFLVLTLLDLNWTTLSYDRVSSLLTLIPFLSVVYIVGIVADRLTDRIFRIWDRPLRWKEFRDNTEYHNARTFMYIYATEEIISLFRYHRHRLRICRAWSVNFALLTITIPFFVWTRLSFLTWSTQLRISIISFVFLGVLTIVTWSSWKGLAVNDYKRLSETYALLQREKQGKEGTKGAEEPKCEKESDS